MQKFNDSNDPSQSADDNLANFTEPPGLMTYLKSYLNIITRYVWLSVLIFLVVFSYGLLKTIKQSSYYNASAKVLIERNTPRVIYYDDLSSARPMYGDELYTTEMGIIKSMPVMNLALDDPRIREILKLDHTATESSDTPVAIASEAKGSISSRIDDLYKHVMGIPDALPAEPWERLSSMVNVSRVRGTHFLQITATNGDPATARDVVNAISRAYIDYHRRKKLTLGNEAITYLESQRIIEERSLEEAENKMKVFLDNSSNALALSKETSDLFGATLTGLHNRLTTTKVKELELNTQILFIKDKTKQSENLSVEEVTSKALPSFQDDERLQGLITRFIAHNHTMQELKGVYGPKHPKYVQAKLNHDLLQDSIRQRYKELNELVSMQLELVQEDIRTLTKEIELSEAKMVSASKERFQYHRLKAEIDRHRDIFNSILTRLQQVNLSTENQKTNVEIVELASIPKAPAGPDKPGQLAQFAGLALLIALGIPVVLDQFRDTVNLPEQLSNILSVPVLGFVPKVIGPESKQPTEMGTMAGSDNDSSIKEAYRNIHTSLMFATTGQNIKHILVTSAAPSDGKSTTASNLALMMAKSGRRTLLIDADLRRPMVHRIFKLHRDSGVSTIISGDTTIKTSVQKCLIDGNVQKNLDIITSGPTIPNPSTVIESGKMFSFLQETREQYDFVIVDAPPALFVTDASILSSVTDGVVLVAKANNNTKGMLKQVMRQLERANGKIIGAVLNQAKVTAVGKYVSEYYSQGYYRYHKNYYGSYYGRDTKANKSTKAG